mgnify:CR=1 FL=1
MNYIEEAKKREPSLLQNLKELVAIPSILDPSTASEKAPFGQPIRQALDWMLKRAQDDGFKVIDVDGYAGAIIYGDHPETVSMLAHLDVVPVGEGWTKDPFGCDIQDGYIFGRGVGDDKGPCIAAYEALKMIRDSKLTLQRNIMLIVGCDEESGMSCIEYFAEHGPKSDFGFVPDASFPVVYGEKDICVGKISGRINSVITSFTAGNRPNVVIGKAVASVAGEAKQALFNFYLASQHLTGSMVSDGKQTIYTVHGKNAHASTPELGVNAANHLLAFIGAAYDDDFALQAHQLFNDYYGSGLGIRFNGAYMGPLTMNLGIVTITDNEADLTIDIRYPSDYPTETLLANIRKNLEASQTNLSLTHSEISPGLFVKPDSFLVTSLMEAYQEITKDTFTPAMTMGGGTYARHYPNHVAFGMEFPTRSVPSFVGGFHELDEGVAIENLVDACAIYANALVKLAK